MSGQQPVAVIPAVSTSPGAAVIIFLMPVVGRLVSKYDARYLVAFGFIALSLALYHMSRTLYPGIDFSTAVWLRPASARRTGGEPLIPPAGASVIRASVPWERRGLS